MYPVTSKFMDQESFRSHPHLGVDFSLPNMTPLRSIQNGEILRVADYGNTNVGKAIFVQWEDGKVALYGHLSKIAVKVGEHVKAGDLIGYSGNSGFVVGENGGYHLHFAVKEGGRYIDPAPYIEMVQKMNEPGFFKSIVKGGSDVLNPPTHSISEMLKDNLTSNYQELFQSFKLNIVHFFSSIDYAVIVQHLQHFFQFFS